MVIGSLPLLGRLGLNLYLDSKLTHPFPKHLNRQGVNGPVKFLPKNVVNQPVALHTRHNLSYATLQFLSEFTWIGFVSLSSVNFSETTITLK